MQVSSGSVDRFHRDGLAVLRRILVPHWIDQLRAGVEHNRTHPSDRAHWYTDPDDAVRSWSDYVTWRQVPYGAGWAERVPMRAVRVDEGRVRVADVPVRTGPGVRVRVASAGIPPGATSTTLPRSSPPPPSSPTS